jgi:hypothetical protein
MQWDVQEHMEQPVRKVSTRLHQRTSPWTALFRPLRCRVREHWACVFNKRSFRHHFSGGLDPTSIVGV